MHIQIVNFNLKDLSQEDFAKLCDELAPPYAQIPGLQKKVWLANPATNTFGGVYFWRDREAMETFAKTELFQSVVTHPNLANITSSDFAIIEGPTRVTHGFDAAPV
jgi:quinol monooxygenase YgiN